MIQYYLLQILLFGLRQLDRCLSFLTSYSLLDGRLSDRERSRRRFESCAHRLKILGRAKMQEIGPADLSCFLALHSSYDDPRRSIVDDDDVALMFVDKNGATFGVFPGMGPVDLVSAKNFFN